MYFHTQSFKEKGSIKTVKSLNFEGILRTLWDTCGVFHVVVVVYTICVCMCVQYVLGESLHTAEVHPGYGCPPSAEPRRYQEHH